MISLGASAGRLCAIASLLAFIAGLGCNQASHEPPRVSTPSEGLVFTRFSQATGRDLFRARIADGRVWHLLETSQKLESNPHWVPSILRVVYETRSVSDPKETPRLMAHDPLQGTQANVIERTFLGQWDASVSADGREIAYVFDAPEGFVPPRGVRVVVAMTAGDKMFGVVPGTAAYSSPRFSPDGDSIAVQVRPLAGGDDLWLLQAEGQRRALVRGRPWHDESPRFTRQGGSIFFSRSPSARGGARRGAGGGAAAGDVCRVHVETLRVDCPVASDDAREHSAEPSPMRDEIVFVRDGKAGSMLLLAGLDGENERPLTDTPALSVRNLTWSPDGERIAYVDGSDAAPRVVVVDRQGAVLFETPGEQPAWAPPPLE